MKLYATTTSERATKGQGGKWLNIEISDEKANPLWIIQVRDYDFFNELRLIFPAQLKESLVFEIPKGKKQKGEKCSTKDCKNYAQADDPKCPAHAQLANMGFYQ
jgi:hypothetical protein